MTCPMKSFLKDCLTLPYKGNSQDNPEHENQVEELLKKHGLEYVAQPNGIQNSPDFHVYVDSKIYSIECKSSKGSYPMYNGGLPKIDTIYVFSSKKYNQTTIFNANDVVQPVKRAQYEALLNDLKDVLEKHRDTADWQDDPRGFDFYIRNMYIQSGGKEKADYFLHEDRERCERNVLEADY